MTLPPTTLAALRARADALYKAADRLTKIDGQLLYGVHLVSVRAYVWATYRRADPVPAVQRTIYGPDLGIAGPAAQAHIAALVKHLAACSATAERRAA